MNTYVIASTRESAGKTSLIIGMASALGKKCGYLKPFGDRLVYQRKKNWDYDATLMMRLWGIDVDPDQITLGFSHSKLRYVYDETSLKKTLSEMTANASKGCDLLFIEGGKNMSYGASISLDSLAIARHTGAGIIIVASGDSDDVLDDASFIKRYLTTPGVSITGMIINKVRDADDFRETSLKTIEAAGIRVLGVVPYEDDLTSYSVRHLAERIFAKVIGGEKGLDNIVKNIFVGAMSTEESVRNPVFLRDDTIVITSGDRSDMILASLRKGTAGIVLTNNIIPTQNIVARASEQSIPLLMVAADTFQAAKQIDRIEALLTPDDAQRIGAIAGLVKKHITLEGL